MYTLRTYQQQAVAATLRHFRTQSTPAVIVLPTGAGKSLVIAELARIAKGRVLVLAHVKELVEQNHAKYESYGLEGGIYSAGMARKESHHKVIFGSIQSVARASDDFFNDFSLLIVDECHRIATDPESQYVQVIERLQKATERLCVVGMTATPYRLGLGWIYQFSHRGVLRSEEDRYFKKCVFEVSLAQMVRDQYLTQPIQIDSPVAHYDFASLAEKTKGRAFSQSDIEDLLKSQERVTPGIVENIVDLSKDRKGTMIFTSSIRHAEEIMRLLPSNSAALVIGDTETTERDEIVRRFKAQEIKFLVNVSVLTTGFDAPHVDIIAILRPTESVSLYQQIAGRGLRLFPGKKDCLILDYTGLSYNIFSPEIADDKPSSDSVPVQIACPKCGFVNDFWGKTDLDGEVIEHYGRKCRGAIEDPRSFAVIPCGFRFRFKCCDQCGGENDIAARQCNQCGAVLVDNDTKLREAMALKDAHVMRPDSMTFDITYDRAGKSRLEIRYYDLDANHLSEYFYLQSSSDFKAFYYNFIRMHHRLPEQARELTTIEEVLSRTNQFRLPLFIIARKHKYYWRVREKVFL